MSDTGTKTSPDRQRLIESLWEDARREADAALAHSRNEADRLVQEARASTGSMLAEALEDARAQAVPLVARILNRGGEASRRRLLAAWQAFLDGCFDEALKRMAGAEGTSSSLRAILTEAFRDLPPDVPVLVEVAPRDLAVAASIVRETGVQAEVAASDALAGGAVVKLDGGREVRDNSFRARLGVLRSNPPLELFDRLQEGGAGD